MPDRYTMITSHFNLIERLEMHHGFADTLTDLYMAPEKMYFVSFSSKGTRNSSGQFMTMVGMSSCIAAVMLWTLYPCLRKRAQM